ncbi:MAG: NAD(P)/FAD-dependent oxidoreductase [Bryobacteraceae bacterium]
MEKAGCRVKANPERYHGHVSNVIIVGAGIIGSAIAWRLAQAGVRVALIDAAQMGSEASWAGAGMLAPGGEFGGRSHWARFAVESLDLYPEFVAELAAETSRTIDFRQSGALEIPQSGEDWSALLEKAETQRSLGIPSTRTDRGLFYPRDASVDPRDVMAALRCACLACGVKLIEHTPVLRIEASGNTVRATTSAGVFEAAAGVLAAGAWSSRIPCFHDHVDLRLPECFPVKGHLLGYRMAPGSLPAILRSGHTYILQRSTGFTIAGSSTEHAGFDRAIDTAIVADIRARAGRLWPALSQAGEPEIWCGFRPGTVEHPVIGQHPGTRLWLAYGHYRNGILMAPATAALVVEQIIAGKSAAGKSAAGKSADGQVTSRAETDSASPGGNR